VNHRRNHPAKEKEEAEIGKDVDNETKVNWVNG